MRKEVSSSEFSFARLLQSKQVAIFLYYATIISIGLFIVRSFVDFPVVDYKGGVALVAYLGLIIILEPPKPAELSSEPFKENDIINT